MNKKMADRVIIYTEDYNYDFFVGEAEWLHKEADRYDVDDFIYDVEQNYDNTGITRITISDYEMEVQVKSEWIEFNEGYILRGYTIRKNDMIRMEIEF